MNKDNIKITIKDSDSTLVYDFMNTWRKKIDDENN